VSLSVLSVPRWGHVSLSLTSFMTPSSLSDELTPTKDVPLTQDPRTMILLLKNYDSSRIPVFVSTPDSLNDNANYSDNFADTSEAIIICCGETTSGPGDFTVTVPSILSFRLKPDTSNSHEFELHRPSNKGTKLLLKVIKAIIIIMGEHLYPDTSVLIRGIGTHPNRTDKQNSKIIPSTHIRHKTFEKHSLTHSGLQGGVLWRLNHHFPLRVAML